MPSVARFHDLLALLQRHRVETIVVGGVAAILHGSPEMTGDLDLVYEPSEENVERLAKALKEIDARYSDLAGRHIVPDVAKLKTIKVNLLQTKLGKLDLLQAIGDDLTYADLLERSEVSALGDLELRVLALDTLVETKEHADRPKDRNSLPYLRELLDRQRRVDDDGV